MVTEINAFNSVSLLEDSSDYWGDNTAELGKIKIRHHNQKKFTTRYFHEIQKSYSFFYNQATFFL